ncbi:MAG: LppX_LprAFG lipoprotein [Anaerolineae bacterium]|nr:LppX_LprAFG lipoprotein [Anaerolineae bacterium]
MKRFLFAVLIMAMLAMSLACGTTGPTASGLLRDAADQLAEAADNEFSIERIGHTYGFGLDTGDDTAVNVTSATGKYEAPDKVQILMNIEIGGEAMTMDILMLDESSYLKMPPVINDYEPFEVEEGMGASDLFSEENGIPYLLKHRLDNTTLAEEEETLDGTTCYHITATGDAGELAGVIGFGGSEGYDGNVDIWIVKDTGKLYRIAVEDPNGDGWIMTLFAYNQGVDIPTP